MVKPKREELKRSHSVSPALTRKRCRTVETDMETCSSEENIERPRAFVSTIVPCEDDVLSIYKDISKLTAIERHLNMLYRPFTCFARTKCAFNLRGLEDLLSNACYEPDRHSAIFVTRVNPLCTMKIYGNGNIYCQAYNRSGARRGLDNVVRALEEIGYVARIEVYKYNVVNATFCLPFPVDLKELHKKHFPYTQYQPYKKPYCVYRMPETTITFAVFSMGYVFVLFAAHPQEVKTGIAHVLPILYSSKNPLAPAMEPLVRCGDINFKVLWERKFQKEDDYSMEF